MLGTFAGALDARKILVMLFGHGFDDGLWSHSRNNSGDSKVGRIEQGVGRTVLSGAVRCTTER
jgi:hypothetical protein